MNYELFSIFAQKFRLNPDNPWQSANNRSNSSDS